MEKARCPYCLADKKESDNTTWLSSEKKWKCNLCGVHFIGFNPEEIKDEKRKRI